MNKKVELLAPAGDFNCFIAAINAGADAVYLAGNKFGARAYANNFSEEEIIEALKIAHLFNRKIYLTVNTLVKENEINELVPFMTPLVNAGLDGVIVQDLGVFFTLRENFPCLELHGSTQMTVTGVYGARFLKSIGATRVVPARELSLAEIRDIKNETGLEVETFIHGAMCYAYSGQCLFSSILGGRSGNRGRCAGPCRLPYEVNGKTVYPLSLKDMYTLNNMPKLIEAGIDSFKIEGRMKSPEYVAGVTSMYRKYIDMYLTNPDTPYQVTKEDERLIRNLYIRSDICEGYYYQHNNKSMVTLSEPGYNGCNEEYLEVLRKKYIENKPYLNITGKAKIISGEACELELTYKDISVLAKGEIVDVAKNRPLLKEDIFDKLSKTGNTCFKFETLEIETDNNSFMPVKALNELRRLAIEKLEQSILGKNIKKQISYEKLNFNSNKVKLKEAVFSYATTLEQLNEIIKHDFVKGIYINSDLLINEEQKKDVEKIIEANLDFDFYLALPQILRKRSYIYLDNIFEALNKLNFKGALCRNMEEYQFLNAKNYEGEIIADYSIYSWNQKAISVLEAIFTRTTMPIELNKREMTDIRSEAREILLYGRLPLMYSANCLQNTFGKCLNDKSGKQNIFYLVDRQKNKIPVLQNCFHCFNVLYNPVVMSLHNQMDSIKKENFEVYRLEFSLESKEETRAILDYYYNLIFRNEKNDFPIKDFTAGHYKRGVE